MPIKIEMTGERPTISAEVNLFHNGKVNFCTIKLGGSESQDTGALEINIDEASYKELFEKMDFAMWDETKQDLENKVEDLEEKLRVAEEQLDESIVTHEEEPSYHEMQ